MVSVFLHKYRDSDKGLDHGSVSVDKKWLNAKRTMWLIAFHKCINSITLGAFSIFLCVFSVIFLVYFQGILVYFISYEIVFVYSVFLKTFGDFWGVFWSISGKYFWLFFCKFLGYFLVLLCPFWNFLHFMYFFSFSPYLVLYTLYYRIVQFTSGYYRLLQITKFY